MLNIGLEAFKKTTKKPFLQTGFRPFFLLATAYAAIIMIFWGGIYVFNWPIKIIHPGGATYWHAHEMIYGYSMAVIAGFLLTAVRNWTRQQTADGNLLVTIIGFWAIGRIPPINEPLAYLQAFGDIMFGMLLALVIAAPILRRKLTKQWPVWIILILLSIFNIIYYLSVFDVISFAPRKVIYMSLYLVLNLIFIFTRRLIPNFITSALQPKEALKNRAFLDKFLIPIFLIFSVNEIFISNQKVMLLLASILLTINGIRLYDWYRKEIWSRHLIWSLYISYLFLTTAFLLKIGEYFSLVSPFLSLHMFTVGGIGMITLSMMSRVSFGHTGRNILDELKATKWLFYGIALAVSFRVILPIFLPLYYMDLVAISMVIWIVTFLMFFFQFFKKLISARADGNYG